MKKEYTYCLISLSTLFLGIICAIAIGLLHSISDSSRGVLILFSVFFILVGLVSYAVHYKKYHHIKGLTNHETPILAHWTYSLDNSPLLQKILLEQKMSSITTAILTLILGILFSVSFLISHSSHVIYIGIALIIFCLISFTLAVCLLLSYYKHQLTKPAEVIFGEDCIYFLDEIYGLQKSIYILENIIIQTEGSESCLKFLYGQYAPDDLPMYTLCIPIPNNKLNVAEHLRKYYLDLLNTEEE